MPTRLTAGGAVRIGSRARKLLWILRDPGYRRALRHGVAASVEHESIPLRPDFATVLDVGANRGQFAVFATRRFPEATIACFEPLAGPRARLQRVLGPTGRLRLFDVAIGARHESAPFHLAGADDSSSLLVSTDRQHEAFPGTQTSSTLTVQVRRLDEVLEPGDLRSPVLLKIDVQGGELGVLEGADGLLHRVDALLMEASFVELYSGQALADDLWKFAHEHGFSCRGVWSLTYGAAGECLLGDLLFAREGFDPFSASSPERRIESPTSV